VSSPCLRPAELTGRVQMEKEHLIKLGSRMSGLYMLLQTQASICIIIKGIRGRYYCIRRYNYTIVKRSLQIVYRGSSSVQVV
jgi:hypothetical protein